MPADNATDLAVRPDDALPQEVARLDLADPTARVALRRAVEELEEKSFLARSDAVLGRRMSALALADAGTSRVAGNLQSLALKLRELGFGADGERSGGLLRRLFGSPRRSVADPREVATQMREAVASLAGSAQVLRQNNVALDGYEADIAAEARQVKEELARVEAFRTATDAAVREARDGGMDAEPLALIEREAILALDRLRQNLQSLLAVNQQAALSLAILRETNASLVGHVQLVTVAARMALETADLVARDQQRRARGAVDGGATGQDDQAAHPDLERSVGELSQALAAFDAWRAEALPKKDESMGELHDLAEKLSEPS